jgi:hypothetical protein
MRGAATILGVMAGTAVLAVAGQTGQPRRDVITPIQLHPSGQAAQRSPREFVAWVPPGTYSAIVMNSSGDERRWAVSLMTTKLSVPIVVPPGDNVIIPFKEGWTVVAADEARIVSRLVPFDDSALYNKVGERPDYVLSAWGISATGPVPFVYREVGP